MAAFKLVSLAFLLALALAFGLALALLPESVARRGARLIRAAFCRVACRTLDIQVEADGALPIGAPILLVANHISWTDVLVLGSVAPIVFVARHDLANWPLLGALARAYGTIFVDRARRRQIPEVNRRMATALAASEMIALFPEATTSDGTRLKKFHSSHFAAARELLQAHQDIDFVSITPVAIAYTRQRGLPLGRTGRASVAWYGDTDFAPHLLDLARAGSTRCRIRFLAPVNYDRTTNRKVAARDAAAAIRTAFLSLVLEVAPEDAAAYVLSR